MKNHDRENTNIDPSLLHLSTEKILRLIKKDEIDGDNLPPKFLAKKEVILALLKNSSQSLYYASDELKNDRELVQIAMKRNIFNLEFASEQLRDDKELILEGIDLYADAYRYASPRLQNDREVALRAVTKYQQMFNFLPQALRNDKEIFLKGIYVRYYKSDDEHIISKAHYLKNASKELQNDRDIVIASIKNDYESFQYASEELRSNHDFVLEAVKINGLSLKYASEDLQNDFDIVSTAVFDTAHSLKYAGEKFQDNLQFLAQLDKFQQLVPFDYMPWYDKSMKTFAKLQKSQSTSTTKRTRKP